VELGCDRLLIRGFWPYADCVEYGRELIPLLRAETAGGSAGLRAEPQLHGS
jgi:hypothetical protein